MRNSQHILKRRLAGTALGGTISSLRDRYILLNSAWVNSPELGDRRNNAIAGFLVSRLRRPGRTFVDVGAHIGSVLGQALLNASGPVIAFEAIPAKAEHLRRRFPEATIHNVALLDREGETSFFIDNAQSGFSSLDKHRDDLTEIKVRLSQLDTLVETDDVDVIKIDVEGAELGVLRGSEAVVARCRPVIMFESGPNPPLGYTLEGLWRWFDDHDYFVYFPDRISRAARAVTLEVFVDSHEYPRRTLNYFGIPKERLAEAAERARRLLREPPH